jgi:hypothetical protein
MSWYRENTIQSQWKSTGANDPIELVKMLAASCIEEESRRLTLNACKNTDLNSKVDVKGHDHDHVF